MNNISPDAKDSRALLIYRLEEIAAAVERASWGLGLLGLGSAGRERERMDRYSDLDFFVVVRPGTKTGILEDCGWLRRIRGVSWLFRNTADGYKLLFDDGIYCEFAIFTPEELETAAYAPGRFIWRDPSLPESLEVPKNLQAPAAESRDPDWLLGEVLSCIYVGLTRYHRGEMLTAMIFIQQYAFNMLMELVLGDTPQPDADDAAPADPFGRDRRIERRYPEFALGLPELLTGYSDIPGSAAAALKLLEERNELPVALTGEIRKLLPGT